MFGVISGEMIGCFMNLTAETRQRFFRISSVIRISQMIP